MIIDHTTHSISAAKQAFKDKGVFYTDSRLAEIMKQELGEVSEVYDPTCGNGQLLAVFGDEVKKYGQEIDETQLAVASERLGNFTGYCGDTLKDPHFINNRFEGIIANPPFSIKWEPCSSEIFDGVPCLPPRSKADYAFILHCLHLLSDDGKAVVLNFPGILYRGQSEGKIRQWLVEQNAIEKVVSIEGGFFADTKIATALVVLRKRRQEDYITFVDHATNRERNVPISEVAAQEFNLSVQMYLPEEAEEKPPVDPIELEMTARENTLKTLRSELEFSKLVCQTEGISMAPFVAELKNLVNEYEAKTNDMKEQEFTELVKKMRYYQELFFSTRSTSSLRMARECEKRVDAEVKHREKVVESRRMPSLFPDE